MNAYQYAGDELEVFAHAERWKSYIRSCIEHTLIGDVLEVGAGIGASTRALRSARQTSWTCLEPDAAMAHALTRGFAAEQLDVQVTHGTIADVSDSDRFDVILYIDVLEHIRDDKRELERAGTLLAPQGRLVVLSPAHQFLYTAFDQRIGHHRRYSRRALRAVGPPGLQLETLIHLDAAGLLLSLGNRLILRSAQPTVRQIRTWDRWFVPVSRRIDPLLGHRFGKSLLAIWRR